MWLPFGLHKIEKPGQGMRARWFAFVALMLLALWGCQSCYRIMYVNFDWRVELPDPSFDDTVPHRSPEAGTMRRHGISLTDHTMVVVKTEAEIGEGGTPPATSGGIPVDGVEIVFNEADPIGKVLRETMIQRARNQGAPQTQSAGQPQSQPAPLTPAEENRLLASVAWTKMIDWITKDDKGNVRDVPQVISGADGGKVFVSGPGTGITVYVTNPVKDDVPRLNLDNSFQYIVPAGMGTDPESGRQLNGIGVPIAGVTMVAIALLMLLLVWKVSFGSWASTMLIETDQELNKVHWPTWSRVYNSSVIVVICTMVFAILLFSADWLLNQLLRQWLQLW